MTLGTFECIHILLTWDRVTEVCTQRRFKAVWTCKRRGFVMVQLVGIVAMAYPIPILHNLWLVCRYATSTSFGSMKEVVAIIFFSTIILINLASLWSMMSYVFVFLWVPKILKNFISMKTVNFFWFKNWPLACKY